MGVTRKPPNFPPTSKKNLLVNFEGLEKMAGLCTVLGRNEGLVSFHAYYILFTLAAFLLCFCLLSTFGYSYFSRAPVRPHCPSVELSSASAKQKLNSLLSYSEHDSLPLISHSALGAQLRKLQLCCIPRFSPKFFPVSHFATRPPPHFFFFFCPNVYPMKRKGRKFLRRGSIWLDDSGVTTVTKTKRKKVTLAPQSYNN